MVVARRVVTVCARVVHRGRKPQLQRTARFGNGFVGCKNDLQPMDATLANHEGCYQIPTVKRWTHGGIGVGVEYLYFVVVLFRVKECKRNTNCTTGGNSRDVFDYPRAGLSVGVGRMQPTQGKVLPNSYRGRSGGTGFRREVTSLVDAFSFLQVALHELWGVQVVCLVWGEIHGQVIG
tara:strand:+ start:2734 stop:3267 length:534 start_codon:yes stop_codon:yes gene_type:complete